MDADTQAAAMAVAAIARNSVEVKERWVLLRRPGRQGCQLLVDPEIPLSRGFEQGIGRVFLGGRVDADRRSWNL